LHPVGSYCTDISRCTVNRTLKLSLLHYYNHYYHPYYHYYCYYYHSYYYYYYYYCWDSD